MKKVIFFVLLAFTVSAIASAQDKKTTKNFYWGYKTGLNVSNIRLENGGASDWKGGLVTGLFFTIKAAEKLSIQPELIYSSMGGRNVSAVEVTNASLRLNYFSIPVLAKYRLNNKWRVVAGPQVDMLIQAKAKNTDNRFDKLTNDFKESSFNATAGAEFTPLTWAAFTVRYIYGFSNVAGFGTNDMKNQAVQLTSAIRF